MDKSKDLKLGISLSILVVLLGLLATTGILGEKDSKPGRTDVLSQLKPEKGRS